MAYEYLKGAPEKVREILTKAEIKTHRLFTARLFVDVMFGVDQYAEIHARIFRRWEKAVAEGNYYVRPQLSMSQISVGPTRYSFPMLADAYGLLYSPDTFKRDLRLIGRRQMDMVEARADLLEWADETRAYCASLLQPKDEGTRAEGRRLIKLVTRTYKDRNVLDRLHKPGGNLSRKLINDFKRLD